MARELKDNAPEVLNARLVAAGADIREKYGPHLGWEELQQLLADRSCVPYPCEIRFDAEPLLPGEFAHTAPKGLKPEEGFTIYVHPSYAGQLALVPYLVLHQLVAVRYGDATTPEDAETFGSCALGLSKEAYYQALCELSGQIGGDELV